jgi:hypothetical protein
MVLSIIVPLLLLAILEASTKTLAIIGVSIAVFALIIMLFSSATLENLLAAILVMFVGR